ncbi:DUF1801 domain-containing protein [Muricauda sp. CAU 1633]|uniref:DUF1801 domain-containing protein n=1 Tax=Allomuricauda sp. CAU 1633 TaxID=2816036 RepID=UPI001A8C67CC|nr:DUF1801 domain-containing protein [Muricauda sp. CAU 1633]MBO0321967.1 DUF1801 domain-containing protein [Muricauda sp. CAU 1633]
MEEGLQISTNPEVEAIFKNYPDPVRKKLEALRELIIEVAQENKEINRMGETLKWGEPSYVTKNGSTIRMDWKPKKPNQYALYFQCTSKLVPTFKMVYNDLFVFEGSRAIVFGMDDTVPTEELKNCIGAALMYHKVKHLPTLGI